MGTTRARVGVVAVLFAAGVTAIGPADAIAGQKRYEYHGQKRSRYYDRGERTKEVFSLMTAVSEDQLEIVPDPDKTAIRRRFVSADPLELIAPAPRAYRLRGRRQVRLELFDGYAIDAKLTRLVTDPDDRTGSSFTWFGNIPRRGIGDVILTVVDGVMMGTIHDDERVYVLRPVAQRNAFELAEIDLSRLPPDHNAEEAPSGSLSDVYAAKQPRRNRFFAGPISPARRFRNFRNLFEPVQVVEDHNGITLKLDSGEQIDLLVAYSPEAQQKATEIRVNGQIFNGVTSIDLVIAHAVDRANFVLLMSGVPTQLNVVKELLLEGPEPTERRIDSIKSGGVYYDQTLNAADQSRADIVSLFLAGPEDPNACGQGEILRELATPQNQVFHDGRGRFSGFGKHWVFARCALTGYSLIHELGHNAGLMHDHYALEPGEQGATPIGFGFVLVPLERKTIMATNRLCKEILGLKKCGRVGRFSDPLASYQGWFLGTFGGPFIDPANNVDAFIQALWTVSNFRPSAFPPP